LTATTSAASKKSKEEEEKIKRAIQFNNQHKIHACDI
jgi:hypothetical protein